MKPSARRICDLITKLTFIRGAGDATVDELSQAFSMLEQEWTTERIRVTSIVERYKAALAEEKERRDDLDEKVLKQSAELYSQDAKIEILEELLEQANYATAQAEELARYLETEGLCENCKLPIRER